MGFLRVNPDFVEVEDDVADEAEEWARVTHHPYFIHSADLGDQDATASLPQE